MTTLTIKVEAGDQAIFRHAMEQARRAARTGEYEGSFVTFASHAQLFEVFTAKRMDLIAALQAGGPMSLRGLASSVNRDVKRVHEDIAKLREWLVVENDESGKLVVPFDVVHFDIDMRGPASAAA